MPDPEPTATRPIRVRILPDWRGDNPYQQLLADSIAATGAKVEFVSHYRRILPVFRDWLGRRGEFDIYHLHWLGNYIRFEDLPRKVIYTLKFLLDLSMVKLMGIRVVWTIHNLVPHEAKYPRFEKWTCRRVAGLADGLIVHSFSARDAVAENYSVAPERLTVIPHGHYMTAYGKAIPQQQARQELQISASKVILFLGFLRPYKGVEALIQGWKLATKEAASADALLLIAGKAIDDSFAAHLENLRDEMESIKLQIGFLDRAKIPVYFSAADAVVLPFQKILTSGSLLLALGYTKPIIAPSLSLVTEILDGAPAFLYEPESETEGLAGALRSALDTDFAPMSARLSSRLADFDWEPIGRKTCELYKTCKNFNNS